jgi:hypothetical protein
MYALRLPPGWFYAPWTGSIFLALRSIASGDEPNNVDSDHQISRAQARLERGFSADPKGAETIKEEAKADRRGASEV